jgi:hypothetical protein
MFLFILGTVFGIGLTLAIRSIDKTLRLRSIRRRVALEAQIEARIMERNALHEHEAFMLQGTTSGPGPFFKPIRHP